MQPLAGANQPLLAADMDLKYIPLKRKGPDPVIGFSYSTWLRWEAAGLIKLTRLTLPGNKKCRLMLPVADAIKAVRKLGDNSTSSRRRGGS